jgi:hypothetical protein
MALADQLVQAKNNATKLTASNPTSTPLKTVYASGADLANAKNTYGNTVNYGDINNPNLKAGDIVAGGSGVTPGISDSMINSAGAQRLSGATANDTLGAMQTNTKTTLPQYYQNTNNAILAGTNYDKLSLQDVSSGYKNQLSDALNNSQYHDISYNKVGMDNAPYINQVNNAVNNGNPTQYQNAVQSALDKYNSNTPSFQDLTNSLKNANGTTFNQVTSEMQKYYPEQYSQFKNARSQGINNMLSGNDYSDSVKQMDDLASNTPVAQNAYTPKDNASYESDMTNRINSLYDTQKNNVDLYYQTGKEQAKQQYAGLRDQASVGSQQNQNKLKEAMAQQGLFNSGDNITSQTSLNNQYQNDLTGYNQQEQSYYNDVANQIAQQKAGYDTQQAQALLNLGYQADNRSFNMANLLDTRNQNQFNNAMTGINAQYGIGQDNVNNNLKGTSMTYNMGRDNVSDQQYNNNTAMSADQINYGRNQDQFNNVLKTIGQQYGMDQDQINNLLKYAQFNSTQDQRQFENGMTTNKSNSDLTQQQTDNSYRQQQANTSNNQWNQQFNYQQQSDATKNSQWQQDFDRNGTWHDQAQALAAAQAAARSSSSGGSRSRSSGGSSGSSSGSELSQIDSFARNSTMGIGDRLKALDGLANDNSQSAETRRNAEEYRQMLISGMHYDNV